MKNILISFLILFLGIINLNALPSEKPSCTQGRISVLMITDSVSVREQTATSFLDVIQSRSDNSPLFGFFLNPIRNNVNTELLRLSLDNFWNNVYLNFYENEELLSRFGDDQKTALELSRALFKTSGLSKGYDREDYQIDEIREFANKEVVRALNGSASLDVELQNQVSLVASKIITLLTQITGTTNVGTENG